MEDQGILDSFNDNHLEALHYIYQDEINRKLDFWAKAWASHRMRTTKSSPLTMWILGQMLNQIGIVDEHDLHNYGTEGYTDHFETEDGERPIFQPLPRISDQCTQVLQEELPSPRMSMNHGINDYIKCVEIKDRFNE